ncbi:MAG: TetR/AcrR family transcriptional regulator [Acetanaerobacterium sp.]
MKSSNNDRRIRKTRALIRQTLTQLLMEKDLKDISVSELTGLADINRGTFYLHYKDIYDLFEQTERDIWEDFSDIISKYKRTSDEILMPILLELFRYISANSDVFIAILHTRETRFLNQFIEMNRPKKNEDWSRLFSGGKEEYYDYYYSFVAFGCVALLRRWFDNGMKESPECMAQLAQQLMANCTGAL